MTRIMQKTYGYNLIGIFKYFSNRILRIYPLYWISLIISVVLVLISSEEITKSINSVIYLPNTLHQTLQNIFIIFSIDSEPRLTPPAWALTVELFFYILIACGISKNKKITFIWLSLSLLYTSYLIVGDASFSYRYFTIPAASLPFSVGALIFYLEDKKNKFNPKYNIYFILLLLFINYFISQSFKISSTYGFYINLLLVSYLVFNLSKIKIHSFKTQDILIGNLSYPIYLLHYQSGIIAYMIFDFFRIEITKGDLYFFLCSLCITIFLSYFVTTLIENKIELLRNKIRPSK